MGSSFRFLGEFAFLSVTIFQLLDLPYLVVAEGLIPVDGACSSAGGNLSTRVLIHVVLELEVNLVVEFCQIYRLPLII